jgi:hypothetical protein
MDTAFAAVKRELLVRYLDTWAPAALHGTRQAGYAELSTGSTLDALRVFAEFPELLAKHRLEVVAAGAAVPDDLDLPAGLDVRIVDGALLPHLALPRDGPLFVYLDAPPEPPAGAELAQLGGGRATELLMALDPARADRSTLRAAGFTAVAHVELVDDAGADQALLFGTGSVKHLAAFKEAMWAVDEYAGVRYRDPQDAERTALDISLNPHVGPLKRALLAQLRQGSRSVSELRDYTLTETIYRVADASRVLTALLGAGTAARTPDHGRLTAETVISAGRAAA